MEDRRLDDVLAYLRQLGATDEKLAAAAASGEPARVALDIVLSRPFTLSARNVAREVGVAVDEVLRIAADMGMNLDDPDARTFSADDIELVRLAQEMGGSLSHVVASAFARIADASVAMYIKEIDPGLANPRDTSPVTLRTLFENFRIRFGSTATATVTDELSIAKANVAAAELALRAADSLRSAFLHALLESVRRQRLTHSNASERTLSLVAVGFVDLVRFTSMSRDMTVDRARCAGRRVRSNRLQPPSTS